MMKTMRSSRWIAALCAGTAWLGVAAAQDAEPSDMVRGGLQVVQLVDQGKAGELWDGASPAMHKRVTRDEFSAQAARSRMPLGAPQQQRTWVQINRQVLNSPDADTAGQYISVEYEARFSGKPEGTAHELVSFRLDPDGVWRFSGYVVR